MCVLSSINPFINLAKKSYQGEKKRLSQLFVLLAIWNSNKRKVNSISWLLELKMEGLASWTSALQETLSTIFNGSVDLRQKEPFLLAFFYALDMEHQHEDRILLREKKANALQCLRLRSFMQYKEKWKSGIFDVQSFFFYPTFLQVTYSASKSTFFKKPCAIQKYIYRVWINL